MTSANLKLPFDSSRVGMNFLVILTLIFLSVIFSASCRNAFADSACTEISSADNPAPPVGSNIIPITFGTAPYANPPVNQPLVSVTICVPGTNHCQTIDNLLLDTGSFGVRIFRSLISIALPAVNDPSNVGAGFAQAECVGYLTGSQWGAIVQADVQMGGQTASGVNIQEIDASYPSGIPTSSDCASEAAVDPASSRYNGIVGVGFLTNDCGSGCVTSQSTNYFKCAEGSTCTSAPVSAQYQTENPVSKMPQGYNNGVAITLPAMGYCGRSGLTGYLALGVGTEQNNTPQLNVDVLKADPIDLTIHTVFEGQQYRAFIDSGTNTYNFNPPASEAGELADCGSGSLAPGFFCPSDSPNYSATM
jgi:hypothetical protein